MPTTNAAIIAELSNRQECDDFTAFLTKDLDTATFLQASATQSLTNYQPSAERDAEMATLTQQIAADRAALPGISDKRRRLREERAILDNESRLLTLRSEADAQGGDDRARKHYERNGYEERIARATELLPLVAARRAQLPG